MIKRKNNAGLVLAHTILPNPNRPNSKHYISRIIIRKYEYTSIGPDSTQVRTYPWQLKEKLNSETRRNRRKGEGRRGRNEAQENQPEQRRSEKYKQRRHNTIQKSCSPKDRRLERHDDLGSLRHRIHHKNHQFLFFFFSSPKAGGPRRSRNRGERRDFVGDTRGRFLFAASRPRCPSAPASVSRCVVVVVFGRSGDVVGDGGSGNERYAHRPRLGDELGDL